MNFSDTVLLPPSCLRAWPRIETKKLCFFCCQLLRCSVVWQLLINLARLCCCFCFFFIFFFYSASFLPQRVACRMQRQISHKNPSKRRFCCVLLLPLSCSDVAAAVIDIIIGHLLLQALSSPVPSPSPPPFPTYSSQLLLLNFLCVVCAQRVDIFRPCFLVWHNRLSSSSSSEAAASATSTSLRLLGVPPPYPPSSLDSREWQTINV